MAKPRNKIIMARKEKGLSQEQVAKIVGISRSFYTHIERGKRNPRYETLVKLSTLLKVDINSWE